MPESRLALFLASIAARPGRAFAGFLALHAAVWTALPTLLYPNLPLDLIEALIYGREWQLGYDKLPPLPWWLVRDRLPADRPRLRLLPAGADRGGGRICLRFSHRAAAGRSARRAGCRAHRRRAALPQLHLRQIQPRRDPIAVLGVGGLCLAPRAARPADDRLAAARPRGRDVAVGEIFRGGAGAALDAVRVSSTATRAKR